MKTRLLLAPLLGALCACSTENVGTRWPASFAPGEAALFSHNEIEIDAPCERVWSHLAAVTNWPSWYSNAKGVHIEDAGPLAVGSSFTWTTFGLTVRSQVRELQAPARLSWYGQADGITAFHAWHLSPLPQGCYVVTEETNNGPGALALRHDHPEAIQDGHATWLAQLKSRAER